MALKIELTGLFNSFRLPNYHTYHKTVGFPPKTTVAGMLGAALGLAPDEVNKKLLINEESKIEIGIIQKSQGGELLDLWKIRKIKAGKKDKNEESNGPSIDKLNVNGFVYYGAVLVREIIYHPTYIIFVQSNDYELINQIKNALLNPVWALSLGREDELILVKKVETVDLHKTKETISFLSTVLPASKYKIDFDSYNCNTLLLPPQTINLPMKFTYKDDLIREGTTYETFIFSKYLKIIPTDSRSDTYTDGINYFQLF
jgi:CRISPR-associated protein Cas5t